MGSQIPAGMPPVRPLDFLLYRPTTIFGQAIKFHTGHNISHVEVVLGRECLRQFGLLAQLDTRYGQTCYATASRDGKGVDFYPLRLDSAIAYVMRPRWPVTLPMMQKAVAKATELRHTPYGWLDLLDFFGWNVNAKGIVCSPYATVIGRAAGLPLFNGEQPRLVAPFEFRTCGLLEQAWTDGKDAAIDAAPV